MKRRERESEETSDSRNLSNVDASGRYAKYSGEQVAVLEMTFSECQKPNQSRLEQLVRDFPVLANVDIKQIKIWFQNRRCREKQQTEATAHQSANQSLSTINTALMEENERLLKKVTLLESEKEYTWQRRDSVIATNGWNSGDVMTAPQHCLMDSNDPSGLIPIAEEALKSFLAKATGTAGNWVPMPGMKPGPNSIGIVSISQSCSGVAARAFGFVFMEQTKVAEVLKDRACWFQDCRSTKIVTTVPTNNGGIIELMYTQTYAPTSLAPARDFFTLRYTTTLEDGCLVVCERSLPGNGVGPDVGMSLEFVRAEILPSGYVIRSCKDGGSILYIVDHINFEAWKLPEVLRPLYESSEVLAQTRTIAALRYVRQLAQEANFAEPYYNSAWPPAILRNYSKKLSRGFNDAINGFVEDGWSQLGYNATEDVIVTVKSTNTGTWSSNPQSLGGIICAKTHMFLENLAPQLLVNYLKHHRSEWASFSADSYCAAALKARSHPHPDMRPTSFSGHEFLMPLGQTIENQQVLEVLRLESLSSGQENELKPWDIDLLQMSSGTNAFSVGAYAELIFASINDMLPDDCFLLPSGFRMIPLIVKSDVTTLLARKAHGPSSSPSFVPQTISNEEEIDTSVYARQAILIMAFQFPVGNNQHNQVALMARQYVHAVKSSVARLATIITPSGLTPDYLSSPPGSQAANNLAQWTWKSYCTLVGGELLQGYRFVGGSILDNLWNHRDNILCFSFEGKPRLLSINQAGLKLLETNLVDLKDITVDKIMSELGWRTLRSEFPEIIRRGYVWLPSGTCTSRMGRLALYNSVVAWKVQVEGHDRTHYFAMSFVNWSFV